MVKKKKKKNFIDAVPLESPLVCECEGRNRLHVSVYWIYCLNLNIFANAKQKY